MSFEIKDLEQMKRLSNEERSSENVAHLATIIAIKEVSDILERVVIRQDKMEEKVDDIHTRVIRMEEKSVGNIVELNTKRIDAVEKDIARWKTQILTLIGAATVAWAIFGDTVSNWIGLIHG